MTKIQEAIQHLNGEIAKLTVARDALVQIEPAPAPDPNRWFPPLNTAKAKPSKPVKKPAGTAVTAAPVKPIKDLAAPVQATEAGRLVRYAGDKTDKPNTMGGAMKYVIAARVAAGRELDRNDTAYLVRVLTKASCAARELDLRAAGMPEPKRGD